MKTTASANFLATLTACALATVLLAGCQKAAETTATPPAEIRGEAISAPVTAPATAAAQTPPAPAAPAAPPVAAVPATVPAPPAPPAPAIPPAPAAPATVATVAAPTTPPTIAPPTIAPSLPTPTPAPAPASPPSVAPTAPATPVAAATPAGSPAAPAPGKGNDKPGDYLVVGFEKLSSFNFDVPDETPVGTNKTVVAVVPKPPEQIPPAVLALDKKFVSLKGFMLPLKVENGLITELLIMRDQSMCCYGAVPKINEWVSVKMTGKGVKPIMDQAVTMYGRLHVGEVRENGYLVGIYTMDGDKITGPLDL